MALGLLGAVVEAMMYGPQGGGERWMSVAGIKPDDPSTMLLPERTFQYWPEQLSDSIDIGWNFKEVAGASTGLAQWGANNGRTFSFELQLHRFMQPVADTQANYFEDILDPFHFNTPESRIPKDNRPHNVDLAAEIRYLRAFCYPTYKTISDYVSAYPPPIMMFAAPGMQLNEDGTDVVYCIMTGCDVTYLLLFPNGVPRRATVSLTLRQIVQIPNKGVLFAGHGKEALTRYNLTKVEPLVAKGGAHKKNDIKLN